MDLQLGNNLLPGLFLKDLAYFFFFFSILCFNNQTTTNSICICVAQLQTFYAQQFVTILHYHPSSFLMEKN